MIERRRKTRRSEATLPPRSEPKVPWLLIAILLIAAFLRLWHIDSVIGGFHDHNEANYSLMAKNFASSSVLFPNPDGHLFLETPPFYAYCLSLIFHFTGVSVLAARLLSVLCSLGLVVSTFLLGRRLFGTGAGLVGSLLVAVSPVAVLTGRNIQTDSMLMFLLVTALLFYRRAESGSKADWFSFGGLFGLSMFTKLFASIALPAIVLWEWVANRERRTMARAGFWRGLAVAFAIPLWFYGYHAVRDLSYLRQQVSGGAAASTRFPVSFGEWSGLGMETLWAFSPLVAVLIAAGALAALWRPRPSRETLFVLIPFGSFMVFYSVVHKHSYYLLTVLPFGALLAGRLVVSLRPRLLRVGLIVAAAATGMFVSLVDLTSMKLGFTEFADFGQIVSGLPGATRSLLVTREMLESHGTVLIFYDPSARLVTLEDLPRETDGRLDISIDASTYVLSFVPPQTRRPARGWLFDRERYGLELFGWTLAEAHANPHFFRQGAYIRERTGGLLDFGLRPLREYPALALLPVPRGMALSVTPQGLQIKPAS